MKKYAVIVAGGSGRRMGTALPKQFLLIREKPVLYYTLSAFLMAFGDVEIILVLPEEYLHSGLQIAEALHAVDRIKLVAGGDTRFQSVKNGLAHVSHDSVIFVHDAVRCLVSRSLIQRCYAQCIALGSAIPAIAATDSIRIADGDKHQIMDRNKVRMIQTPQTFQSAILLPAFEQPQQPSFTDEASVVEAFGQPVFLIEGEHNNLKITRPIDLYIAEKLLEEMDK